MQMLQVSFVSASGSNDGYYIEESDGNVLGIGNHNMTWRDSTHKTILTDMLR